MKIDAQQTVASFFASLLKDLIAAESDTADLAFEVLGHKVSWSITLTSFDGQPILEEVEDEDDLS